MLENHVVYCLDQFLFGLRNIIFLNNFFEFSSLKYHFSGGFVVTVCQRQSQFTVKITFSILTTLLFIKLFRIFKIRYWFFPTNPLVYTKQNLGSNEWRTVECDIQNIGTENPTNRVWANSYLVCRSCTNARAVHNSNKTANESARCVFFHSFSLDLHMEFNNFYTSNCRYHNGYSFWSRTCVKWVDSKMTLRGRPFLYSCLLWDHYETRSTELFTDFVICFLQLYNTVPLSVKLLCFVKPR
jgi:hypothetical protein